MTVHAAATGLTLAVKNGPAGMWRALGSPGPTGTAGRLVTSWVWLVAALCAYLALALFVYRRARRRAAGPGIVGGTVLLGPLLAAGLVTWTPALGLLALVLMAGVWSAIVWRSGGRRVGRPPENAAEVIDLARWRADRLSRRKAGSR